MRLRQRIQRLPRLLRHAWRQRRGYRGWSEVDWELAIGKNITIVAKIPDDPILMYDPPLRDGTYGSRSVVRTSQIERQLRKGFRITLPEGAVMTDPPSHICTMQSFDGSACEKAMRSAMDLSMHEQAKHPTQYAVRAAQH